ncbi:inosine/xanthosine triphosphatase [Candidatus Woesearchaeota archaeon]|nr:inosine/xanthosine triphosphatase [Candidatus Woesearchaeota archaeon]
MKVIVGSTNPNKVRAVKDAFSKYFEASVQGTEVDSGVSKQPLSMKEIVQGAKNRAMKAYSKEFDYSVGLEAGLFVFPEAKTHYLDVTCCAIFDGKDFFIGLGPAFEYPDKILQKILTEGKEASDAADEAFGSTNIKHKEGIVGMVTKGRVKRNEFVEASVMMALSRIVSKELYD